MSPGTSPKKGSVKNKYRTRRKPFIYETRFDTNRYQKQFGKDAYEVGKFGRDGEQRTFFLLVLWETTRGC